MSKQESFQRVIKKYLDATPKRSKARARLCQGTKVPESTLYEWADGSLVPSDDDIDELYRKATLSINMQMAVYVSNFMGYEENGEVILAKEFEVAISTVRKWSTGSCNPHPLRMAGIIDFITSYKGELL